MSPAIRNARREQERIDDRKTYRLRHIPKGHKGITNSVPQDEINRPNRMANTQRSCDENGHFEVEDHSHGVEDDNRRLGEIVVSYHMWQTVEEP